MTKTRPNRALPIALHFGKHEQQRMNRSLVLQSKFAAARHMTEDVVSNKTDQQPEACVHQADLVPARLGVEADTDATQRLLQMRADFAHRLELEDALGRNRAHLSMDRQLSGLARTRKGSDHTDASPIRHGIMQMVVVVGGGSSQTRRSKLDMLVKVKCCEDGSTAVS